MEKRPFIPTDIEVLIGRRQEFHQIAPSIISTFIKGSKLAAAGLLVYAGGKFLENLTNSKTAKKYKQAGLGVAGLGVATVIASSLALELTGTEMAKAVVSDLRKLGYSDEDMKWTDRAMDLYESFVADPEGFKDRLKRATTLKKTA